jgi:NhaP-type Na+/H+ or K+/H+ antiporter
MSPAFLGAIGIRGYAFAALALPFVRPLALGIALLRSGFTWREGIAAGWFGPRGFVSAFFALLILHAGIEGGGHLFYLAAVTIAGSIRAHSSSDVLLARWLEKRSSGR